MAYVVQLQSPDGVDRLEVAEVVVPAPRDARSWFGRRRSGVNFSDIYLRTDLYPLSALPAVLGVEGARRRHRRRSRCRRP